MFDVKIDRWNCYPRKKYLTKLVDFLKYKMNMRHLKNQYGKISVNI